MKKLQIATNGHPRTNNDLVHLQEAIMEIGSALGMLCTDSLGTNVPIVVGGLKFTSLGGGVFTYGDCYIYYNGEIFYFPGTSPNIDPPDYLRINSIYAANNPYLGKNIHNIRTIIPIYGLPIAGDVPFFNFQHGVQNIVKKAFTSTWYNVDGMQGRPSMIAGNSTTSQTIKVMKDVIGCVRFQGVLAVQIGQGQPDMPVINLPAGYRVNSKRRIKIPIVNPPFSQSTQINPTDHFALLDNTTNQIIISGDYCDYIGGWQSVDLAGINYIADL
jgi:hypothetical protein